ncbi:hypothetical protein, partial [Klebsiella pneumoniae]|uniref:hypothetical protein n=1 Tax=Klebsiella pneumoniae TaxID=573 RepID=UPI002730ADE7
KLTSYFVAGCVIDRRERIENPLSARLHTALANILDKVPSHMLDDLNPYIDIIHSLFEEVKEFDETESDYS